MNISCSLLSHPHFSRKLRFQMPVSNQDKVSKHRLGVALSDPPNSALESGALLVARAYALEAAMLLNKSGYEFRFIGGLLEQCAAMIDECSAEAERAVLETLTHGKSAK